MNLFKKLYICSAVGNLDICKVVFYNFFHCMKRPGFCKSYVVGVKGGKTITFDSVMFTVGHVISLYGKGNTDFNLIIKQFSALFSGTDLYHIKFATFALLPYL